jgi:signal transduction histidine kinase
MGEAGNQVRRWGETAAPDTAAGPVRPAHVAAVILRGPVSSRTWLAAASLAVSLLAGAWFFLTLAAALVLAGALSWIAAIGVLIFASALRLAARLARFEQWRVRQFAGARIELALAAEPSPRLSWRQRQRAWARSAPALRAAVYQLARLPVVAASVFVAYVWWQNTIVLLLLPLSSPARFPIVFFGWRLGEVVLGPGGIALGFAGGIVSVFAGAQIVRAASAIDVALARALLGPSRLSSEVARLSKTRALALEAAESERRRIERDLHDGIQPKLVSLAMQLGLARARFDRDPGSARTFLAQAHDEAKTALADLRGVVRGIHPSVLDERGLDAALSGLVAGCPVPVRVDVSLAARPDRTREAIAYFVAAEAITNVTRHSGARKASVTITGTSGLLHIVVDDDGHGGAAIEPGGGLAGLAARVAAIDGTLTLTSPPGGPTRIDAVIPCEP